MQREILYKTEENFMKTFQLSRKTSEDGALRSFTNSLLNSKVVIDQLKMTIDQESPRPQLMKIKDLVHVNRLLTIREFTEEVEISVESC